MRGLEGHKDTCEKSIDALFNTEEPVVRLAKTRRKQTKKKSRPGIVGRRSLEEDSVENIKELNITPK
jgi:hypothetical protein